MCKQADFTEMSMCSVGPAAAALAQCIVVCVLKEAAAPESEEFEVSAKSAVHRRLVSLSLCLHYTLL